MMKYIILIVGITSLFFISCTENESINEPTLHDTFEIDIDEDGLSDYSLKYSYVDIEPLSISDGTFGIVGSLVPIGQNEILRKLGEKDLFLRDLNEIELTVLEPLSWKSIFSQHIVLITTVNSDGDWPSTWEISADSNHPTYFFGLKLVSDLGPELAWLELEINTFNGIVTVVDKGLL